MNCLECGEKIIGRSDKKFCNDACRNAYNNKQNKDSNNLMRNINNKLRKNYRILTEINTEGKLKLQKQNWMAWVLISTISPILRFIKTEPNINSSMITDIKYWKTIIY
jgi:predicted nucleic acid-binding Zn ribbon protein